MTDSGAKTVACSWIHLRFMHIWHQASRRQLADVKDIHPHEDIVIVKDFILLIFLPIDIEIEIVNKNFNFVSKSQAVAILL